ncbi:MAG: hypothetical protein HZA88_20625 [Verrucomicrobia bacterium]|nr:hypothetical protein [Verrucomicrobiota bacterium]
MEVAEGTFDYIYDGNNLARICEGNRTVLEVLRKPLTNAVSGLMLINGEKIEMELGPRPRVQVIKNQNVIGGVDESLSKITRTNGTIETFMYGVDEKLNPKLKLQNREIIWNAAAQTVMRDGEWRYSVTRSSVSRGNAAIARTNAKSQKEFWHRDDAKGEETVEGVDGIRKVKTWFTSGMLKGKVRKEEEIKSGVKTLVCALSYNEKGRLIRIRREKTDTFLVYEDDGRLAGLIQNGQVVRSYTTNAAILAKPYVK